jgi:thiol-disulfide isomerase/thioredoxin
VVLAAGAALVLAAGAAGDAGPSVVAALERLSTTGAVAVALGATTVAVGCAFAALLLRHGRLLARVDALERALAEQGIAPEPHRGLPVGSAAPAFALPDLDGAAIASATLIGHGTAILLLFMEQGCGPCRALLPEVVGWQAEHRGRLQIVVVTSGEQGANRTYAGFHGLDRVLFQEDREVARAFEVSATPSAVLIDIDGRIASDVAPGADAIRSLMARPAAAPLEVVQVPARDRRAATAARAVAAPARR